ncbi:hypothetical protein R53718_MFFEMHAI_01384 [Fructobacillus evanidus]|uniref:putative HNHc nuclease n=1 Tax=Fructobacillus evanidus TaxID=3064281 RepID=UPI002D9E1722|nr:hypothetical protein R53718_MFFEMHAI_01384 [Fructobacillus sp. LMG 32999]
MEAPGKVLSRRGNILTIQLDDDVDTDFYTDSVGVVFRDEHSITAQQRKFAYAIMADIAKSDIGGFWAGDNKAVENYFKAEYCLDNDLDYISLSTRLGNRTDANEFISMLLDFSLAHNVALSRMPVNELEGDVGRRFEYSCLINKKCVICGTSKGIEFAHCKAIGFVNSRQKMNHLGWPGMALCHQHHQQQHSKDWGIERFMNYYHLQGVPVDERIAKIYHLHVVKKEEKR